MARGAVATSLARRAEKLEVARRRDGLSARRIALRLTGLDERTVTRSRTLSTGVGATEGLAQAAQALLDQIELGGHTVRRSGLVLKGLEIRGAEDRQLDLF